MKRLAMLLIIGIIITACVSCSKEEEGILSYNDKYTLYDKGISYIDSDSNSIYLTEDLYQYSCHAYIDALPYQAEFIDKSIAIEEPLCYQWGPSIKGAYYFFIVIPMDVSLLSEQEVQFLMYDNLSVIIECAGPTLPRVGYFYSKDKQKIYSIHTYSVFNYTAKLPSEDVTTAFNREDIPITIEYSQSVHSLKIHYEDEHRDYIHSVAYFNTLIGARYSCNPPYPDTHEMEEPILTYIKNDLITTGYYELYVEALD